MILFGKANTRAADLLRAGVGRHHQYHVAEIGFPAVVVGQRAVVHYLQQQIENLWVCLLDLIQQHHTVRMFGHRFGQQTALVETDVARGSTDETGDRVPFHVLGHVVAQKLYTHDVGQLPADLGLTDAGRTCEEEGTDGFLTGFQSGPGQLDGTSQGIDGFILTEHHHFQLLIQIFQSLLIGSGHLVGRDTGNLGNHLLHI